MFAATLDSLLLLSADLSRLLIILGATLAMAVMLAAGVLLVITWIPSRLNRRAANRVAGTPAQTTTPAATPTKAPIPAAIPFPATAVAATPAAPAATQPARDLSQIAS